MNDIFEGRTILITGGTGFLGRNLVKGILKCNPKSIRVFSRDEVKHHHVQELFKNDTRLRQFIGDVRDYQRLEKAMRGVDYVIHGAALKRLDLIEYNVEESIKTNIMGTLNVVNACLKNFVRKAVFVSTDKACAPVNTYGATKLVGERIFVESNFNRGSLPTVFTCVRYGNVLESTGSVIPFFQNKLREGATVPLTDDRMTRFIISDKEAVQLIYKAIKFSIGGEVFVPRLPAFKVLDLVEVLNEAGNPEPEVKIVGIRPGEKIHELMINTSEVPRTYSFDDLYVITSQIEKFNMRVFLNTLYMKGGSLLPESFKEYSSEDAVVSTDKLREVLEHAGILQEQQLVSQ